MLDENVQKRKKTKITKIKNEHENIYTNYIVIEKIMKNSTTCSGCLICFTADFL